MRTADFDFELPLDLIAQQPAPERDQSRLLVLNRAKGELSHQRFSDLPDWLRRGDLLVVNDSRVIPARLRGAKSSGAEIEMLLLEEIAPNDWWVMLRPGKRVRPGTLIGLRDNAGQPTSVEAKVIEKNGEGHYRLGFSGVGNILQALDTLGEAPLPPYITRPLHAHDARDLERYQTIFAEQRGSVAAPTAGLHFTHRVIDEIRARQIGITAITLHVGLGTFAPVKTDMIYDHPMHAERFSINAHTTAAIAATKKTGGRVVAVGTTSVRVLESVAADNEGRVMPTEGRTRIFVYPPYPFQVVDAMLTNFHLPKSTLLTLVSAFAAPNETRGRDLVLHAYAEAVRERYRFFSYGDAMLIL